MPPFKHYGLKILTTKQADKLFCKRVRKRRRAEWLESNDWMLWLAGVIGAGVVWFSLSDYPEFIAIMWFW